MRAYTPLDLQFNQNWGGFGTIGRKIRGNISVTAKYNLVVIPRKTGRQLTWRNRKDLVNKKEMREKGRILKENTKKLETKKSTENNSGTQ